MPRKALKPCRYHGCTGLTSGRLCAKHGRERALAIEEARPSSSQRGYDSRWASYSRRFLREHPVCSICGRPSRKVDHIIAVRRGGDFWDPRNHQALCIHCHARKTAALDGGFGNTPHVFSGRS